MATETRETEGDAGLESSPFFASAVRATRAARQFKRMSSRGVQSASARTSAGEALLAQVPPRRRRKRWHDLRGDARGLLGLVLTPFQLMQISLPCLLAAVTFEQSLDSSDDRTTPMKASIFCLSWLAIIPSATLLGDLTEHLALWLGETLGALVNATVGNLTELLVSLQALRRGKPLVVQASLVGSILSNMLLVLGLCFFVGGIRFHFQYFNPTNVMSMSSNLLLSALGITIPTLITSLGNIRNEQNFSLSAAIVLFSEYVAYLFYSLYTHSQDDSSTNKSATPHRQHDEEQIDPQNEDKDDAEQNEPCASAIGLVIGLVLLAILLGWESDQLVSGIEPISQYMPRPFVSMILLPIVGNAAEHLTAVIVAYRDKLDLAINVALGSALQISLGVLPFLVILSTLVFKAEPLTLIFPATYVISLIGSVMLMTIVTIHDNTDWMKGAAIIAVYLIIALSYWYSS